MNYVAGGTLVTNHIHARYVIKVFHKMVICRNTCGYIREKSHTVAITAEENLPLLHNLNFTSNDILANALGNASSARSVFCIKTLGNAMCADIKESVLSNAHIVIAGLRNNGL